MIELQNEDLFEVIEQVLKIGDEENNLTKNDRANIGGGNNTSV